MNDVKSFDTGKNAKFYIHLLNNLASRIWETDSFIPYELGGVVLEAPSRRMHHAADVYGCMLVVHGGFSGEDKEILDDLGIYDLSKQFLTILLLII